MKSRCASQHDNASQPKARVARDIQPALQARTQENYVHRQETPSRQDRNCDNHPGNDRFLVHLTTYQQLKFKEGKYQDDVAVTL
jgi:hypothetical protein